MITNRGLREVLGTNTPVKTTARLRSTKSSTPAPFDVWVRAYRQSSPIWWRCRKYCTKKALVTIIGLCVHDNMHVLPRATHVLFLSFGYRAGSSQSAQDGNHAVSNRLPEDPQGFCDLEKS